MHVSKHCAKYSKFPNHINVSQNPGVLYRSQGSWKKVYTLNLSHKQKDTNQAVDHLIEHRSQTPPVHCPVVGFLTKNLWSQVLQTHRTRETEVTGLLQALPDGSPSYCKDVCSLNSLLESRRKLR